MYFQLFKDQSTVLKNIFEKATHLIINRKKSGNTWNNYWDLVSAYKNYLFLYKNYLDLYKNYLPV